MSLAMDWTLTDLGDDGGDPTRVNPYADWEPYQRRPALSALPGQRYRPVYLRVTAKPKATARALLERKAVGGLDGYILDTVATAILRKLADTGDTDRYGALFVYCKDDTALPADSTALKILYVAPALALPIKTTRGRAPEPTAPPMADGVLTAVIDDFIGFANDRFLAGQDSRIQAVWGQDHPTKARSGVMEFGGVKTAADITALLAASRKGGVADEDRVYRTAFSGPALRGYADDTHSAAVREALYQRPFGYPDAHGTHVLDLAAGEPREAEAARPILAVQLPQLATAETWGARLDHFLLIALHQVLLWADNATKPAPLVINISYAVQAGLKDGTGFLATEITRLIEARNADVTTRLVLAAGNSYRSKCHAEGTFGPARPAHVFWRLPPEDQSDNFLEVVAAGAPGGVLSLTMPQGGPAVDVPLVPGRQAELRRGDLTLARAVVLAHKPGSVRCVVVMAPTQNRDDPARAIPPGDVGVGLTMPDGRREARYYIDVQRDDTPTTFPRRGLQSYLESAGSYEVDPVTLNRDASLADDPIQRTGTLSPFATSDSKTVLVVGGAIAQSDRTRPALYTSSGPTDGRAAPDCAAVSDETFRYGGQLGAGTFSGGTARLAGSSVAAPLVARALVDAVAAGKIKKGTTAKAAIAALGWPATAPEDTPQLGRATQPLIPGAGRMARRENPFPKVLL